MVLDALGLHQSLGALLHLLNGGDWADDDLWSLVFHDLFPKKESRKCRCPLPNTGSQGTKVKGFSLVVPFGFAMVGSRLRTSLTRI